MYVIHIIRMGSVYVFIHKTTENYTSKYKKA